MARLHLAARLMGKKGKHHRGGGGGGGNSAPREQSREQARQEETTCLAGEERNSLGQTQRTVADDVLENEERRLAMRAAAEQRDEPAVPLLETDLSAALAARRRALIAKNLREELSLMDIVQHEVFINAQAEELLELREQLSRKHKLCHARIKTTKDAARISSLITQGEKVERDVGVLNANVQRLHMEADWLHGTAGWLEALRQLSERTIKTAAGEVLLKSQLEEDEALFDSNKDEEGELSFEGLLQAMKDEDAGIPMDKEPASPSSDSSQDTKARKALAARRVGSRQVSLFGSRFQVSSGGGGAQASGPTK